MMHSTYYYSLLHMAILTPSKWLNVKARFSRNGPPRASRLAKCCMRRTTTYPVSTNALCWPRHTRGPPLKGKYAQRGRSGVSVFSSQRPGRNSSASGPYISGRRCIAHTEYCTAVPLATKTGERPSEPPPRGRVVFRFAKRKFSGTGGWRRRAI